MATDGAGPDGSELSEWLGRIAQSPQETFSPWQVRCAIEQFLEYGEQQFMKSQKGYYSGSGWAARCLRFHLEELKRDKAVDLRPNVEFSGVPLDT